MATSHLRSSWQLRLTNRNAYLQRGALLLLMYDPVKLAEDIAVLDHLSGGRIGYTIGLGYREEEYAMFGIDSKQRGKEIEERITHYVTLYVVNLLNGRGEKYRFSQNQPLREAPSSPTVAAVKAAAERAARLGMMFFPQTADPAMAAFYDAEAERVGNPTGMTMGPEEGAPTTVFVAEDLDKAWPNMGHICFTMRPHIENGWEKVTTLPVLAKHQQFLNCEMKTGHTGSSPPKKQYALIRQYHRLSLQPLCGGVPQK